MIKHSFSFYLTKRPFSNNPIFCPEGGGDNIEQESIFSKKALWKLPDALLLTNQLHLKKGAVAVIHDIQHMLVAKIVVGQALV